MAIKWTTEQQQVIDLRDRNLLVSAAAGSGKTAVLVERILSRILDPDPAKRVDVDQLLIVTFTKAAAAEMRSRIESALRARLQEEPDNTHLQRQLTLVHYAQITTIHSFCNHVVRSHFDELDLDPDFRVADEGELKLLRGDLLEDLLEEHYRSASAGEPMGQIDPDSYLELVETLSVGKTDQAMGDWIEKLYFFACAYPFPEKTLQEWAEDTSDGWISALLSELRKEAGEVSGQCQKAIRLCGRPDGPAAYGEMFRQDQALADRIGQAADYEELQQALGGMQFVRKPTIRKKEAELVDPALKTWLSDLRDDLKGTMKKWAEKYAYPERQEMERQTWESQGPIRALCYLTMEFCQRFQAAKKEKHMADFNDLEHLALQILVKEEDGRIVPTEVAEQLQKTYKEVMIDEYQDSNMVQELLLSSVDGHWNGQPNRFMVGDVKQSIYKFRMARPEIFMEKYASYSADSGPDQKIDLHQNFRSRRQVLESANYCFRRIMMPSLGGVAYDDANALYPGAVFAPLPEGRTEAEYETELLLADLEDEAGYLSEVNAREAEAKLIAKRIRELTDEKTGLLVWDKEAGAYRVAHYGDIVILLRTFSGWSETFAGVLQNAGIPAYAQQTTGYFTAMEVQILLNYLRILDNPMQDIPLASVMHSQIGGFSSEELAVLQAQFGKREPEYTVRGLYGACLYAVGWNPIKGASEGQDPAGMLSLAKENRQLFSGDISENGKPEERERKNDQSGRIADRSLTDLSRKVERFLAQLESLRRKSRYLPLHELLQQIYSETGYYELVSIMPGGSVRRANLDTLMEKAIAYEGTSYYGLFDFVRYIDKLHSYEVDFGEAAPEGENGDTVRITTIHKSKGLEFPIVFVAGMGKPWNKQDSRGRMLMHPELGLAADYVDSRLRLRVPTLKKRLIARQLERDNLGEELRVLYVAMTRAKEKLILTGTDKALHKKLAKAEQQTIGLEAGTAAAVESENAAGSGGPLLSTQVAGAGSYLDWILMCLPGSAVSRGLHGDRLQDAYGADHPCPITLRLVPFDRLMTEEVLTAVHRQRLREDLENWDTGAVYDAEMKEGLPRQLSFRYPYSKEEELPVKLSVSELKHAAMDRDPESCHLVADPEEQEITLPRFLQQTVQMTGASRGTVYHKCMERMDFAAYARWGQTGGEKDLRRQLEAWQQQEILTEPEAAAIDVNQLMTFAATPVMERMAAASEAGLLHKEKPFVIGIPAKEIYPETESEELVVVQGIIDVYWQEGDAICLLDYKTDRVPRKDGAEILKKRYRAQLEYYARALEQATGLPVREKVIYSFTLGETIHL